MNKNHLTNINRFTVAFQDQIIAITRHDTDTYSAMGMNCTHLGCEISPIDGGYVCPCHGAKFDFKGKVKRGPTEIDLPQFSTRVDDTNIYIEL